MRIKGIFTAAALFMSIGAFPCVTACADEPSVPSAEMRAEADGLDISGDVQNCYSDIERLHDEGVRLFDTAGLLGTDEKDSIEKRLDDVAEKTGFDIAIVTATDISGYESTMEFSDDLFYYSNMGVGEDRDGTLLVMETYDSGSSHISTSGMAIRYITDSGIDYIYDSIGNGGVWGAFQSGDIYNACMLYAKGVETLFDEGIGEDQHNIDESGQTDYYYPENKHGRTRSLRIPEIIVSAIIGLLAGFAPVSSIKKSYAMKDTAAASGQINKAYVSTSGFAPTANVNAVFVDRIVTKTPIPPKPKNSSGSGHGGGSSSTHTGSGGHSFGGGGRGGR